MHLACQNRKDSSQPFLSKRLTTIAPHQKSRKNARNVVIYTSLSLKCRHQLDYTPTVIDWSPSCALGLSAPFALKPEREAHAAVMSMMSTMMSTMMPTIVRPVTAVVTAVIHHAWSLVIIPAVTLATVVVRGTVGWRVTATISPSVATAAPCFCCRCRSSHPRQTCQHCQNQN